MFDFLVLASAILFISIDFVYLNIIRDYFSQQIRNVQGSQMKLNYLGAALCYIFLIVGINFY